MDPNRIRNSQITTVKIMKIILDTNFLTIPEEKKIDIFTEIKNKKPKAKFITLKSVEKELDKLNTKASEVGKQLLKEKNIKIIEQNQEAHTDDNIVKLAEEENAAVATNDKELRKRCRKRNISTIYLRSNKKIEIE